ncbi:hypothetical protein [Yoonia sp. I 8.24]|uniref:hypothetical protein n=1 Tax=Yoonia sp. I 8.24 TaxID=1537229 RepID=UPI001EE0F543|nr:hypothetical protein [Yoonia sp. I 8.24]MCG3267700.1 hypothetical protein [Yoonia sp. I 8.24]
MDLTFDSVLRAFEITGSAAKGFDNHVFTCQAYDPTLDAITQFARLIDANEQPPRIRSVIIQGDTTTIGSGEDPRPFFWHGSACICSQVFSPDHGYINRIYVSNTDKWIVLIPPKGVNPGKNWAPFVRDEELYFVHEYAPFRVLKARFVSPHDGFLLLDIVAEHAVTTPTSGDGYSQFRGGTNALQIGNKIVGIGHTNEWRGSTKESIVHRPFLFVYQPEIRVDYYAFDFDFPKRFKIIDPTSFYERDGALYLVTCETETVWSTVPQNGRSCLYLVDIENILDKDGIGSRGRRLHGWAHGEAPQKQRFLGAWRRPKAS